MGKKFKEDDTNWLDVFGDVSDGNLPKDLSDVDKLLNDRLLEKKHDATRVILNRGTKVKKKIKDENSVVVNELSGTRFNKRGSRLVSSSAAVPITQRDYEARVYLWLIDGWTPKRITDELMDKYGIKTVATARSIINSVNSSYSTVSNQDIDELKMRYLEMYGDLYKRSLEKKDLATARNILDSVVKLQGLITNKVESKVENVFTIEF